MSAVDGVRVSRVTAMPARRLRRRQIVVAGVRTRRAKGRHLGDLLRRSRHGTRSAPHGRRRPSPELGCISQRALSTTRRLMAVGRPRGHWCFRWQSAALFGACAPERVLPSYSSQRTRLLHDMTDQAWSRTVSLVSRGCAQVSARLLVTQHVVAIGRSDWRQRLRECIASPSLLFARDVSLRCARLSSDQCDVKPSSSRVDSLVILRTTGRASLLHNVRPAVTERFMPNGR